MTANAVIIFVFCYSHETNGWTPLTFAAARGHEMVVEYLLKSGADKDGKFLTNEGHGWNVSCTCI